MHTVLTKEIENVEVIVGFDRPVLDPVGTKEKTLKILSKDDKYNQLVDEVCVLQNNMVAEFNDYHTKIKTSPALRTKESYELFLLSQEKIRQEIQLKVGHIIEMKQTTFKNNHVFFEPKLGEKIIDENEYHVKLDALKKLKQREYLTPSGNVLQDNRGRKYYYKDGGDWRLGIVVSINEKIHDSAVFVDELDANLKAEIDGSIEGQRIAALSETERAQEAQVKVAEVTREAALRVIEADLTDAPKDEVRKWLQTEKEKIEKLYKV